MREEYVRIIKGSLLIYEDVGIGLYDSFFVYKTTTKKQNTALRFLDKTQSLKSMFISYDAISAPKMARVWTTAR